LVRSLLQHGAPVNQRDNKDQTPLHLAVTNDHIVIAELLLDKGADVNAADASGSTPLHIATFYDRLEFVQLLLKRKAAPSPKDKNGDTPLHLACRMTPTRLGLRGTDHLETATALLDGGANPVARNNARQTPLDTAITASNSPVIYLLRTRGVRE
jgi:cytohesin